MNDNQQSMPQEKIDKDIAADTPTAISQPDDIANTAEGTAEQILAAEDEVITALVAELAEARKSADEARDHALRAQAELQNFRRRKEKEAEERVANANARLLIDLLPVVDDFERAFANVPPALQGEEAAWAEGFALILRKLQALLERQGVTPIDATGSFDPTHQEAISVEPSDEVASGEIIAEVQRGYKLGERVLRPSYVRVAQ